MDSSSSYQPTAGRSIATAAALGVLIAAGLVQPVAASAAPQQRPSVPSALSTSPVSSCPGDTLVGDTDVTLYAVLSGPQGGTLGAEFQLVKDGGDDTPVAESDPTKLTAPSGSSAVYVLPKAVLEAAAGGRITEFNWKVRAADATLKSGWSTTCHFSFDPTRPGTPVLAQPGSATIGKPVSFAVGAPTGGTVPSGYTYQLDAAAPVSVTADASGRAVLTLTPTTAVNSLSVTSLSAGGNPGGTATINFVAATPPPDLTTGDLTGDGVPDLLTVGAQNGLPSGIWLAAGHGDGHVATSPTDIGVNGTGWSSAGSPSDFDGATAITGRFTAGPNQDVLVYYPTGIHAGGGLVLRGNGTGAPLAAGGNTITSGTFQDFNGNNPTQLADAGTTSGGSTGFPDLLGVLGDAANGYGLDLYQGGTVVGQYQFPVALNVNTPDGTADWNNWTIATTQLPATGGGTSTAMYLWKKSTGELDLWENLAADPTTGKLNYHAYPVATGWNTGADVTLQAADINSDGVPDLWTVGAGGTVTATLVSNLSDTAPATLTQVTDTLNAAN